MIDSDNKYAVRAYSKAKTKKRTKNRRFSSILLSIYRPLEIFIMISIFRIAVLTKWQHKIISKKERKVKNMDKRLILGI